MPYAVFSLLPPARENYQPNRCCVVGHKECICRVQSRAESFHFVFSLCFSLFFSLYVSDLFLFSSLSALPFSSVVFFSSHFFACCGDLFHSEVLQLKFHSFLVRILKCYRCFLLQIIFSVLLVEMASVSKSGRFLLHTDLLLLD